MSLTRKNILYAILSGCMLTASFPPGKTGWIAWFAIIPLLKSIEGASPFAAFRLGIIAGLAHYLTLVYWIISVLDTYGGLNFIVSFGILILLCLYLSLYTGVFSLLSNRLGGRRFPVLMIATFWVSLEFIRGNFLTGFPWCLLGYSQHRYLALVQIADLVGVYGISFLIVAVNTLLYVLFVKGDSPFIKELFRFQTLTVVILFIFSVSYGHYRLSAEDEPGHGEKGSIKVAIIQGNIDQSVKWNPAYQEKTVNTYLRLTRAAYPHKPDLVVWPETATPFFFQEKNSLTEKICTIASGSGAHLIFGSPAYERGKHGIRYYNRIYHLAPRCSVHSYYDKVHLVPFGEYVPLKRFLPFVHRLVPAAGDFTPGEVASPIQLPDCTVGPLICYESIFPDLARAHVKRGADIFVNLTNDAWFGKSSAPYHHLVMSSFRAIENRRPLIRAANTGFSAFIDRRGVITKKGELFSEEVLVGDVDKHSSFRTFYSAYGDVFAYLLILIGLIKLIYELCYQRWKNRRLYRKGG